MIECCRADGVKPGGRLIKKKQQGIKRKCARKARTFFHAARELRRIFRASVGRKSRDHHLIGGDFVKEPLIKFGIKFAQRHLNIFSHGERGKECAALEQDTPTFADGERFILVAVEHRFTENLNLTRFRTFEANYGSHQYRFASTRPANNAENFAIANIKINPVMHRLCTKTVDDSAHTDRNGIVEVHTQPTQVKNTAKNASSTITRKMACTTAAVVLRPTSSALFSTNIP